MCSMVYCLTIFEEKLARPVKRFSYIGTILRWICARRKISTLHIQLFILHQQSHSFSVFGQLGTFITIIENSSQYIYHFWNSAIGDIHHNATLLSQVPEASDSSIYIWHISVVSSWFLCYCSTGKKCQFRNEYTLHQKMYILNALTHISPNGNNPRFNCRAHFAHFRCEIWLD